MRTFVADYIDRPHLTNNGDLQSEMESLSLGSKMSNRVVETWGFESGLCTKVSSNDIEKYGQGIFIMKFIDCLTQCQKPIIDFKENLDDSVAALYDQFTVELLTQCLINYS